MTFLYKIVCVFCIIVGGSCLALEIINHNKKVGNSQIDRIEEKDPVVMLVTNRPSLSIALRVYVFEHAGHCYIMSERGGIIHAEGCQCKSK